MNILFWSGGKDCYLAWHFFTESHPEAELKLLTTYDETNNTVPHQQIPLAEIEKQANHLNLELITVGLPPECSNKTYLDRVNRALKNVGESIDNLIFGDWHQQEIREWREQAFGELGYSCLFPIWKKSIHELLPVLLLAPIEIEISAVNEEYQSILKVGETYDQKLVTQLQRLKEIDPMGENGEFHTKVIFKELQKPSEQPLMP